MDSRLGRAFAIAICGFLLLFGLARIGIGSALLGQELGLLSVEDFAGPIADTREFLDRGAGRALIPLSASAYFAYIVAMGVALTSGAIGMLRRQRLGFAMFALYLAMHGALFVNFLTINPKIGILGAGIVALGLVWWLRGPERAAT